MHASLTLTPGRDDVNTSSDFHASSICIDHIFLSLALLAGLLAVPSAHALLPPLDAADRGFV